MPNKDVLETKPIETKKLNAEIQVIMPFEKVGEFFVEDLGEIPKKPFYSFVKRFFDILVSFVGVIVLALPMLIIALIIKTSSKGGAFFKQDRLGQGGKTIKMIKFRTMYKDAEKMGAQWSQGDKDPRIFPFGRFLRKSRLDELPQLLCILKGDMSLVGPRPERECFYEEFETYVHGFSERLKVKPGLTGLAQINGGYELKPEEKIVYDIEYIKKRSLWTDIKILFGTVAVIFTHEGAK